MSFDDTQFHTTDQSQAAAWMTNAVADKPEWDASAGPMTAKEYAQLEGIRVPRDLEEGTHTVYSLILPDGEVDSKQG